jgi:asparagine synthase (glutamine-hydrolysing)
MAQGLEVRVPYCDHRLVQYALDETRIKPLLDTPPDRLAWGPRLRLERVVDLALWLEVSR